MATSATQRTMTYCCKHGMLCGVVEKFVRFGGDDGGEDTQGRRGVRRDLYGFIDVLACDPKKKRIYGIQCFTTAMQEHYRKVTEDPKVAPNAIAFLESGGIILLMGWRKLKLKRGGKAMRWTPRIQQVTMEDLSW